MASQELVRFTWSIDPGNPVSVMSSNEVIYNNGNDDAKYVSNNTTIYNSAIYIKNNNTVYVIAFGEQSFTVSYGGGSKAFSAKVGNYYGTSIQNDNGLKYMYALAGWGSFSNIQSPTVPVFTNYDEFIAYCTTPVIPTYNWESVASITGKNKTYRLTDILNINDGSPMNDVQYDGNLDFSAKSKVNNMIDDIVIDPSKVTVEYSIPSGTYQYIKLVYKRGGIPADYEDGTAVDIVQSSTKKAISDIVLNGTYWFVIFTDVSESEPVSLKVGNGNELVLIDSYDNYRHAIVSLSNTGFIDGMISKESCYWWYEEDGTFIGYDRTQAQAKCVFKTPLRKGTATAFYVECTSEAVYNYPDTGWGLFDLMPTQWGFPNTDAKGHVLKWLYDFADTTKATYMISLDDIDNNKVFYIGFYRNSTRNVFYKMWFDGMPEFFVLNDLTTWNNYLGDNVIKIQKRGSETDVIVNPISDWEHIVFEADVEESSSYSFKYDCKCNMEANERSYTANQMAAYILVKNPEDNADWWSWQGYILSENGGNLKTLGKTYQTYNTTFTTREGMKKVWICLNYSALSDGQRNIIFTYKNISLTKTS